MSYGVPDDAIDAYCVYIGRFCLSNRRFSGAVFHHAKYYVSSYQISPLAVEGKAGA